MIATGGRTDDVSMRTFDRAEFPGTTTEKNTPEDERDVLEFVSKIRGGEGVDGSAWAVHRQWWLNVCYFLGIQFVRFSGSGIEEQPQPRWKRRFVANKIMPLVLRNHARLASETADLRAVPTSTTASSRKATRYAEKLLEHLKYVTSYDDERAAAILYSLIFGTGFVKITWDPKKGEVRHMRSADDPDKLQSAPLGELEIKAVHPMQIRVPWRVTCWEDMPWIMQTGSKPLEYVRERWGDAKADRVQIDESALADSVFEARLLNTAGLNVQTGITEDNSQTKYAKVEEVWSKPCKPFPRGLHAIVAGGVLMEWRDNPYLRFGCPLPYVPLHFVESPGRFWGVSQVEQLIHPQQEYNITRSQIIENAALVARPKLLTPIGSQISRSSYTSAPGEIIYYNSLHPAPTPMAIAPLPNYVVDHLQLCREEMADIAAQQDVSQAKSPASVRSGTQVRMLQNADQAVLAMPRRRLFAFDKKVANTMLKIAKEQYVEARKIVIAGPERRFDVMYFDRAMIEQATEFRIYPESGALDSKAARQETILDLVELGVFNPQLPEDKLAILRSLEIGDSTSVMQEALQDQEFAEFENEIFSSDGEGETPVSLWPARDFENHEVHWRVHNTLRKSAAYRALAPERQAEIDKHAEEHLQYLLQAAQAQMAQKEAEKGAPGEKGEPGQKSRSGGKGSEGGKSGGNDSDDK